MRARLRFLYKRMTEILWVRPLLVCLVSIAAALLARGVDRVVVGDLIPEISKQSIETLLTISASSMLVIATFAVGSMISAFASASSSATPRTFPLMVADDISQNALSVFIGAFIFSIVTLVAVQNDYYQKSGHVTIFLITVFVFALVVVTFVRWMDRIARLGRLGHTVDKVEEATRAAFFERKRLPNLGGVEPGEEGSPRLTIVSPSIGYVQRIDLPSLQRIAESEACRIFVNALPGTFVTASRPVAMVYGHIDEEAFEGEAVSRAFIIGDNRTFDEDPRFGLIVLSEIASKALSPAINDPGTAIDIIGTLVRLFAFWADAEEDLVAEPGCMSVAVPALNSDDMLDDAFSAIARDGAATVEVGIRLQKALAALADYPELAQPARRHAQLALARAEKALDLEADIDAIKREMPV